MFATLKLLFVCDSGETLCPFLTALQASGFHLLVAHPTQDTQLSLSNEPVTAITIHHDNLQVECSIGAKLKRAHPQTPVILLRDGYRHNGVKPAGVDAICYVDAGDDQLCRAMATFLGLVLEKQTLGQA